MSRLLDVTPFGARFRLTRPTEPGRLLHLTLPMPRPLRVFDHVEDQYRLWSLVRNLKLLDPAVERGALVEIGVAFVGKRTPRSFELDPSQRYDIAQSITDVGWTVNEGESQFLSEFPESDNRKESRHNIPIEVLIEVFDKNGQLSVNEKTVTENISPHGAAVFTSLTVSRGRFVKVSSAEYRASVLAVVRDAHTGADNISRLHLEFIGNEWPLDIG